MPQTYIRPELLCAWKGPSVLVVDTRGNCDEHQPLSGYYFREARHLRTLQLTVDGQPPWLCEAAVLAPDVLAFTYIHPELTHFGGGGSGSSGDAVETNAQGIPYRALDIRVRYEIGIAELRIALDVTNRSHRDVAVDLAWSLGADFADIQEAQGGERHEHAPVRAEAEGATLTFVYAEDALPYRTCVGASGGDTWRATPARLAARLALAAQQTASVAVVVRPDDPDDPLSPDAAAAREHAWRVWRDALPRVRTPGGGAVEAIVEANLRDVASLPLLEGAPDEWLAMQAGMPVYPALFGRDALTAGWHAAWVDRAQFLDATLTRLGRLQADRVDPWRDAEPGRIPFQLRRGPLARLGRNPFGRYYADFASPLMFVISLSQLYAWTGDRDCLRKHWDTARRVLDWAREYGDRDGDGYLEYLTMSPQGPKNQGWKDSGNAVLYEDGSAVPSPIATCELQGYWFAAQELFAVLSGAMGELENARAYWESAMALRERFNRDWWMEEEGFYAFAMDPEKRLVRAATSNVGQCLTTGIIDAERQPRVVGRLFAPDLFSGWMIRTLSTEHGSYNPLSYHLGGTWAVENATIAFGLRRFGFDARALELCEGMFDLARRYPDYRIPECVGGYARGERATPGAYPRANTPQLWNATGIALLVHTILGLQPVAPLDTLVFDPALPAWLPEVIVEDLRVGGATATLRCWRDDHGTSHGEVLRQRGTLHLVKQPPPEAHGVGPVDRLRAFVDGVWHR